jgi:hypothetical protein
MQFIVWAWLGLLPLLLWLRLWFGWLDAAGVRLGIERRAFANG